LNFYQTQFKKLISTCHTKIKSLGTCALTVIIYNQKIYVANCGDSEAIAVLLNPTDNKISYLSLNERFSANNLVER
jgi:serine/threonine protein phosphatase PrpC